MKNSNLVELYKFYRNNLSYFALVSGGQYLRYKRQFIILLVSPFASMWLVGFFADRLGFLNSVILVIVAFSLLIYGMKVLREKENKNLLKFHPQFFDENGNTDIAKINSFRKIELKKQFQQLDILQASKLKKLIKTAKKEIKKAVISVGVFSAIYAGIISLIWEDLRKVLIGRGELDPRFIVFWGLIFGYAVYLIVIEYRDLNFGKWPLYKELLTLSKEIQKESKTSWHLEDNFNQLDQLLNIQSSKDEN